MRALCVLCVVRGMACVACVVCDCMMYDSCVGFVACCVLCVSGFVVLCCGMFCVVWLWRASSLLCVVCVVCVLCGVCDARGVCIRTVSWA